MPKDSDGSKAARSSNRHESRESWLASAISELRPYFAMYGYDIPEKIRCAIAFTSQGKNGKASGETWPKEASKDGHFEVILRAEHEDPAEILGILVAKIIHTLLPPDAKHGKDYKAIATRLGLEGPMRHARPGPALRDRLNDLSAQLGSFPHAKLDHTYGAMNRPKKQGTRMRKAECSCGYTFRIAGKWAKKGALCPEHGAMTVDISEEDDDAVPASIAAPAETGGTDERRA